MYQKNHNILKVNNPIKERMIIRDSFDQVEYRSVNVKNAKVWLDQNYNALKSPTFSRSFRTLLTRRPHTIWTFWILGTCKTYCNHISIWASHNTSLYPFVKIILDHGSQTSTPFFFYPIKSKLYFFEFICIIDGCRN